MFVSSLRASLVCAAVLAGASVFAGAAEDPDFGAIDFRQAIQLTFEYRGPSESAAKAWQSRLLRERFNVTFSEANSSSPSRHEWVVQAKKLGVMKRSEVLSLMALKQSPVPANEGSSKWSVTQSQ